MIFSYLYFFLIDFVYPTGIVDFITIVGLAFLVLLHSITSSITDSTALQSKKFFFES